MSALLASNGRPVRYLPACGPGTVGAKDSSRDDHPAYSWPE